MRFRDDSWGFGALRVRGSGRSSNGQCAVSAWRRIDRRLTLSGSGRVASRAAAIDAAGDLVSIARGERAVGAECRVDDSMDIAREDAQKRD